MIFKCFKGADAAISCAESGGATGQKDINPLGSLAMVPTTTSKLEPVLPVLYTLPQCRVQLRKPRGWPE